MVNDLAQLGSALAERDRVTLDEFYENPATHAEVVRSHIGYVIQDNPGLGGIVHDEIFIDEVSQFDPEVFKDIRARSNALGVWIKKPKTDTP